MNIQVILDDLYPNGMACTVRTHLYAKGFVQSGHKVFVLIPRPYEKYNKVPKNPDHYGIVDDIEYKYSALTTQRSRYFLVRQVVDIFSLVNAAWIIFKRRRQTDVMLIISDNLVQILLFKLMAIINGTVIVQEKSEFPFIFHKKTLAARIYQKLYIKYVYRFFDGLIVISRNLEEYFENKIKHSAKILHVPIIVDSQIFNSDGESDKLSDEVVYAGILNQSKDGVLDIIRAFYRLNQVYHGKKLILMGDIDASECKEKIYEVISENNLANDVIITGYLPRAEMVNRLRSADVLILAKPAGLQSEHSFPTKIGEYLATGKPVVLTDVGCISQYLTDGINAFIAKPDNIESLSGKLLQVYSNYKVSVEIGRKGQKVATDLFDYRNQSRIIIDFFGERIRNKNLYG